MAAICGWIDVVAVDRPPDAEYFGSGVAEVGDSRVEMYVAAGLEWRAAAGVMCPLTVGRRREVGEGGRSSRDDTGPSCGQAAHAEKQRVESAQDAKAHGVAVGRVGACGKAPRLNDVSSPYVLAWPRICRTIFTSAPAAIANEAAVRRNSCG